MYIGKELIIHILFPKKELIVPLIITQLRICLEAVSAVYYLLLSFAIWVSLFTLTNILIMDRNGSAVKIEIGLPPDRQISTKFPKEYWKTFTAIIFVLVNFIFTTVSLSITHELRNVKLPPLPDITLDHLPYRRWALDVSEILIMLSTIVAALLVVFHKYRLFLNKSLIV